MAKCRIEFRGFRNNATEYFCLEHLEIIKTDRDAPPALWCNNGRRQFMNREEEGNAATADVQSE